MNRWLLLFLVLLTGVRLYLGGQMELAPDEAYYFQWAQRLDWSYYSKGPGVAAVIRTGTELLGPTAHGIRLFSPLFGLGTCLLLYAMARRLYGEPVAIWSVLLLSVTPIFQVGSVVMTIDAVSIFFWMAALYTFWRALELSPRFSFWWPLTGAVIGLGFLAKYTNAIQLLSILLILLVTPKLRKEFRLPGFWSLLGVFSLALIPPVMWNRAHAWITLQHLTERGHLDTGFSLNPGEWFTFLGIQFGVYSPLIYGALLAALWWGAKEARNHFKPRFLILFALPILLLYYGLSIKKAGQANWTGPAFLSLGILTVACWHALAEKKAWARGYAVAGLALGWLVSMAVLNVDLVRMVYPLSFEQDPGARLRGWESVARGVETERQRLEKESGKRIFLIANRYQSAASIGFYLPERPAEGPGHPPVYIPESQAIENQFSFWPRYDEMIRPVDYAKGLLAGVEDPAIRQELAAAIKAEEESKAPIGSDESKELHRAVVRAILKAHPEAPVEPDQNEESGVSLFHGRDALFITDGNNPPSSLEAGFESVECIVSWEQRRHGKPLRVIHLFLCRNYHGLSL